MDEPSSPNADQIAYWNAQAGEKWADNQARIDSQFAPLTEAAIAFARVPAGARVLDVGCGAGATVLALAEAVGPGGHVMGVDISRPMLDVARRRVQAAGLGNVQLELADAAAQAFPQAFDLMFSRFGVMFFDDPPAAFGNIRTGMKPGGRLAFVCWRPMSDNSFFLVPWLAAKPFLPEQPKPDPYAPGPFAFADADRVRGILHTAGWKDIDLERRDLEVPGRDLEAAVDQAGKIGPVSRALAELDDATRARCFTAIEAAFRDHLRDGQVVLGASVWFVSAVA